MSRGVSSPFNTQWADQTKLGRLSRQSRLADCAQLLVKPKAWKHRKMQLLPRTTPSYQPLQPRVGGREAGPVQLAVRG